MSFQESVFIRRPLFEVVTYMGDITMEKEWQTHLVDAEQIPPGPTIVGTRRRYVSQFLGKELVNTYIVKVHEPGVRLVCTTTPDSVLDATSDIRWEEVGGGTKVTMTFEGSPSGPLKFVPRRILDAAFENEVTSALARLKERLEEDG
jgi:carbon monoxide dehydrogenase subunit G